MPSILTLYKEKHIHLNIMKTYRGVYHLKDVIKQQDVFLVFSKRRLNCLDVFRHSVEKPHKTCTTQLVSSTVFESSYFIGSSEWKRIQWSTSLNLHSVFDIVLIYFFEELQPFLTKFDPDMFVSWQREQKTLMLITEE